MNQSIDLLKGKRAGWERQEERTHSLKVASLVFLTLYCLLAGAVFSYWLYLDRQNQLVGGKIAVKKQQVEDFKEVDN